MARIAVISHCKTLAEMFAGPLVYAGHEVVPATAPIDFEALVRFGPQLIVLGVDRRQRAADRPIENTADLAGYEAIAEMERYPAIAVLPLVLVANGVQARDVPTSLRYDAFLGLPDASERYVPTVEALLRTTKSRRKLSGYVCPHCGGRMTYTTQPVRDLFCPRCHTAVTLIDEEHCQMMLGSRGQCMPCTRDLITPKAPATIEVLEPAERRRVSW